MQASAAGADQAFRLDHLFDTRKMAWKRTAIGCARFGDTFARRGIGFFLGADCRDGRFQVLQRQIELVGISLLGFAPERDRKSTRLNSSHANISYAVFCLKKKK